MSDLDKILFKTLTDEKLTPQDKLSQVKLILAKNRRYISLGFEGTFSLDLDYTIYEQGYRLTAAAVAATQNNLEIVRELIENGGYDPKAALYIALENENIDIVRYCLLQDADPIQQTTVSATTTPHTLATRKGSAFSNLLQAYYELKKTLAYSLSLPPRIKKEELANTKTRTESIQATNDAKESNPPLTTSLRTVYGHFNQAWNLDPILVMQYLAKYLQQINTGEKKEQDYPLLDKFSWILFKCFYDGDYPDQELIKFFDEILIPEWVAYFATCKFLKKEDGFFCATDPKSTTEFLPFLEKVHACQKQFEKNLKTLNSDEKTFEPTQNNGGLEDEPSTQNVSPAALLSLSSPLYHSSSPITVNSELRTSLETKNVSGLDSSSLQPVPENKALPIQADAKSTEPSINFFEAFFSLSPKEKPSVLARYTDFNPHQIKESVFMMLKSFGVEPALVEFCNAGGGVLDEAWDLHKSAGEALHNFKSRYVGFVSQTGGGIHAVAGLFAKKMRTAFVVDPERNRNDAEAETVKQVTDTLKVLELDYSIISPPPANPDNTPQGANDRNNCGFYAAIIILAMILTAEGVKPHSDNPTINKVLESLFIDVKAGKLPKSEHLAAYMGALVLAYETYEMNLTNNVNPAHVVRPA